MSSPDQPVPLATAAQMDQSTLRELVASLSQGEQRALMERATRSCEAFCDGRRLAPFTAIIETHRVEPVDIPRAVHAGLAAVGIVHRGGLVGAGEQGGQVWLDQYAPAYADLWTYSAVSITATHPDGLAAATVTLAVPAVDVEADTGLLRLPAGVAAIGGRVRVTYSGGYTTVPAGLVQACRLMAAAELADEPDFPADDSDSDSKGRVPPGYASRAARLLAPYRVRR